jgi:hypothetical protein
MPTGVHAISAAIKIRAEYFTKCTSEEIGLWSDTEIDGVHPETP